MAAIFFIIAGFLLLFQYFKTKNKLLLIFSVAWILWGFSYSLDALADWYYNPIFTQLSYIPQSISVLLLTIFFNLLKKDNFNIGQHIFSIILGLAHVISGWLPNSIEIIPEYGIHVIGTSRIVQIIMLLYIMTMFISWNYQIIKATPPNLKGSTKLLTIGVFIQNVVTFIMYIIGTFSDYFGATVFMVQSLGALFVVIVLIKEPKLLYILPFTAYKFIITCNKDGEKLYEFNWSESNTNSVILSKLLTGMKQITTNVLTIGDIQQIKLKNGYLMINYRDKFSIGVTASKTSTYLIQCMNNFAIDFENNVKNYDLPLTDNKESIKEIADSMISKYFANIPIRKGDEHYL